MCRDPEVECFSFLRVDALVSDNPAAPAKEFVEVSSETSFCINGRRGLALLVHDNVTRLRSRPRLLRHSSLDWHIQPNTKASLIVAAQPAAPNHRVCLRDTYAW